VTWHHVVLIGIAAIMVLVCGAKTQCEHSLPAIVQLATVIISGALGHAGAKGFRIEKTERQQPQKKDV